MKRSVIMSLLCLFSAIQALGQKPEITTGPVVKYRPGNFTIPKIVKADEKGYYIWWKQPSYPNKRILEYYDMKHELKWEKPFEPWEKKREGRNPESIYCVGGKLLLYSEYFNAKRHVKYAYLQYLDDAGNPTGEEVLADSIQFNDANGKYWTYFMLTMSADSSKLMVTRKFDPGKNNGWEIFATCFDMNLQQQWHTHWNLPYEFLRVAQIELARDGSAYWLLIAAEKSGKENKSGLILEYYAPSAKQNQYMLQTPDAKFFTEVTIRVMDKNNKVICAGFHFSDEKKAKKVQSPAEGIFVTAFERGAGVQPIVNINRFDSDFIQRVMSEEQVKDKQELPSLTIRYLEESENGDIILLAEHYELTLYSDRSTTTAVHRWKKLACFRLSSDGRMIWSSVIPRSHTFRYSNYSAYDFDLDKIDFVAWQSPGQINILYNDNLKKEDKGFLPMNENPTQKFAKINLQDGAISIDDKLEVNTGDKSIIFLPEHTRFYLPNEAVLFWGPGDMYSKKFCCGILSSYK